jgi:hypothetical protein
MILVEMEKRKWSFKFRTTEFESGLAARSSGDPFQGYAETLAVRFDAD